VRVSFFCTHTHTWCFSSGSSSSSWVLGVGLFSLDLWLGLEEFLFRILNERYCKKYLLWLSLQHVIGMQKHNLQSKPGPFLPVSNCSFVPFCPSFWIRCRDSSIVFDLPLVPVPCSCPACLSSYASTFALQAYFVYFSSYSYRLTS
jgi:hypothetical protein